MPRGAKPKAPRRKAGDAAGDAPTPDGVFDTAAPPPPQVFAKGKAPAAASQGSLPPSPAPAPPAGAAAAPAGPACTFGLGGGLLAKNAVLFWVLTGLTYAAGLWLLGYMLLVLYLWWVLGSCAEACGEGCEGCTCSDDGCCCGSDVEPTDEEEKDAPGFAALPAAGAAFAALGLRRLGPHSLAHHPDLPEFAQDVWRVRGWRVCVGCSVTYPTFLAGLGALTLAAPDALTWWAWLAGGTALASVQAVSALGWTRWRWLKAAVKACLGLGLAAATHGVLAAPWPHLAQGAALTALAAAAAASALPRRRRIAAALAARRPA